MTVPINFDSSNDSQFEEEFGNQVFHRYSGRLIAFAHSRLPKRLQSRLDSEDIVQSVFRSFFRRSENGEFSFEETLDVWRLLSAMTFRKVVKSIEHHRRQKRDFSRETVEVESADPIEIQPTAEQAAMMIEDLDWIFKNLPESSQEILKRKLDGFSVQEIAMDVGISQRTVKRVLAKVRELAEQRISDFQP